MASSSQPVNFEPEPDLHPLYPSPSVVAPLLSNNSGLSPAQRFILVSHCITRACIFADISFLQYILHDPQAQSSSDLNYQDDDGLVFASVIILGFGAESDRDVEREECVRLLISEGADMNIPDKAGWTPLHHAALLAPPTLISHLLTHGCSPMSKTGRGMTALDIITAYSVVPGREDVALFLEEAMRGMGWECDRMHQNRLERGEEFKKIGQRRIERENIGKVLELNSDWWLSDGSASSSTETSENEWDNDSEPSLYTPDVDYASMLVFSPSALPSIFDSLITNFRPMNRNADPANALYMLTRFACLACDQSWLEDLVIGAADAIETAVFTHPDDLAYMIFWLYNCTIWLHLLRCDNTVNEACEMLGSFEIIEEIINAVYVLIIRFAERKIDKLIDSALLDHSMLSSELEPIQFESEWSLFRSPFSSTKRKAMSTNVTPSSTAVSLRSTRPSSPSPSSHPPSPIPRPTTIAPSTPKGFSSLRQSITRARGTSTTPSLHGLFTDVQPTLHSPREMTTFLTALHSLLTDSGVNPALITQMWSQVMYWTSSEMFNRILTRKRHLCRSRALEICMNLNILEEWIHDTGLPRGVESHFAPARELLHWLQCLSSMDDFPNLVATIQTMKRLNPLQMRRAVRDYRYEVNEARMSEDCAQYLAQLQKDWERERVKLGVEALRKEIQDRDRDRDDSNSSEAHDQSSIHERSFSSSSIESSSAQKNIDLLFDRNHDKSKWQPHDPPEALGELLESRYMLPLLLPSDPRLLATVPGNTLTRNVSNRGSLQVVDGRRQASSRPRSYSGAFEWYSRCRQVRKVKIDILNWIDGAREATHWVRGSGLHDGRAFEGEDGEGVVELVPSSSPEHSSVGSDEFNTEPVTKVVHLTHMNRVPSSRSRTARSSTG